MRPNIRKRFTMIFAVAALSAGARAAGPDVEQRVAAQRAIEQVYWSHRIWPEANPGSKPKLDAVLSDADLRARVEDTLRQSEALDAFWNRPVTTAQLQAEISRMVAQTRDGAMLRELFDALGDDPALIAETLARPALVRRLIRSGYAFDPRFHGQLRARAEAAVAACRAVSCMPAMGGEYRETIWRVRDDRHFVGTAADPAIPLDAGDWAALRARLEATRSDALEESAEAFTVTSVISQSDREVKVATTTWEKRGFDAWWAEQRGAFAPVVPVTAGSFTLAMPQSNACADDTWTGIPPEIPEPRASHAAVWTGSEMIVWGGNGGIDQNSGGRYDPATDTWTMTSTAGAPAARHGHAAVWTGTTMIVWGGAINGTFLGSGGRYDPTADAWSPTSNGANVPSPRLAHTAIWTGAEMIVWGGNDAVGPMNSGARYNPGTDAWTATSTGTNVPAVRSVHTAVWTGTQMVVWGGQGSTGFVNTGGRYTPATDAWTATSTGANVPAARIQHTAVWTGSVMIVWGGQPGPVNTGGRYNPTTNAWTATSTGANVPTVRLGHTAVWTGTEMIVWGGYSGGTNLYLGDGGRYNPTTNAWTATASGANVPTGRYTHTAVWTGTEMIVWGGATPALSYTGGRYNPTTNSWVATSTGTSVPTARFQHTGIWTGAEMIVWGGRGDGPALDTGAAYDPATAAWSAIAELGAPTGRQNHTAVWTGTKMIVWGGANADNSVAYNTGGAYDPTSNSWTPTSVALNNPASRYYHTAVWTGSEMIVWGGQAPSLAFNTGGRYAPATDTWTPTSTGANVPAARALHIAAWTGSAMVVWGTNQFTNTGGRYYPATDSWLPTSLGANVPAIGTGGSTSAWTGSRVIIWGGSTFQPVNSGELYDPAADTWTPMSTGANCPSARTGQIGVWTGRQLIVWGGSNDNTGGRYDPANDSWTPTSTGTGCPTRRSSSSGVWTGTEMIVWGGAPTSASGGRYCACAFAAPAGAVTLSVDKAAPGTAHLSWTYGGADAAAFDVVRGDLAALSSSGGDFSAATSGCLANDVSSPVEDTDIPLPGAGVWYMLRPVNCGGKGSYGSASRDIGIAGSGHDCS